jgi:hypothetical protein
MSAYDSRNHIVALGLSSTVASERTKKIMDPIADRFLERMLTITQMKRSTWGNAALAAKLLGVFTFFGIMKTLDVAYAEIGKFITKRPTPWRILCCT